MRQELFEPDRLTGAAIVEDDHHVGRCWPELVKKLSTSSAGCSSGNLRRRHGNRDDLFVAGVNGSGRGDALGADRQSITCILDVAPGMNGAVCSQDGRADGEPGVGHVSLIGRGSCESQQFLLFFAVDRRAVLCSHLEIPQQLSCGACAPSDDRLTPCHSTRGAAAFHGTLRDSAVIVSDSRK